MTRTLFRRRLRFATLVATATAATLALAAATHPGGMVEAYEDCREYGRHHDDMDAQRGTRAALDAGLVNLAGRIAMKEQWLDELIAGRATLRETAQRFMDLNRSSETAESVIAQYCPGATYEEKATRNVIDHVKTRLRTAPFPSNTQQRIQSQFQAQFGTAVAMN